MQTKTPVKWEEKTLGDVCDVIAGQSPEGKYYNNTGNGLPFYQGKKGFSEKYIGSPTTWTTKTTKEALEGDILMSVRAPVGPINYATQKCCIGRGLAAIRRKSDINHDFLFYYLLSKQNEISGHEGVVFSSINRAEICSLKILMPTIEEEQQRIVKVLDKAFEDIEQLTANAKQNLQNAKDLFESYINQIFVCGTDWQEMSLGKLTTKIGSGSTPKGGRDSYHKTGISLVRSMNVYDRAFAEEGLAFIDDEQAKKLDGVTLYAKDVLINITGGSIARCCVIPDEYLPARVNQHVSIVRAIQEKVLPEFLCYLLTARTYKHKLLTRGEEGGSTRQALTKTDLESFKVCIPKTIEEQQQIIDRLDSYLTETKQLEQIYQQKIEQAEELKQSILQKAFNGEL